MFGVFVFFDRIFRVVLRTTLWIKSGIFLFTFESLWERQDTVCGTLSVSLLIVNEDEFITLYDEISLFKLSGSMIGSGENIFEGLLELNLKFFLFCQVILLNWMRWRFREVIEVGLNEELDLVVIRNRDVINGQYGLDMVLG